MAISEKMIRKLVDEQFPRFVQIRRDFHQHPELGLAEFATATKIEQYLHEWGISATTRVNKTSIIGMITGTKNDNLAIAMRADIDALPIQENNNHNYQSVNNGVMHACGHDVHMTILLGAAYVLQQLRQHLSSCVKLFFQQAEESVGGAKTLIAAGALENPNVTHVIGMHVCPKLAVGEFGIKYQHAYAASDTITLVVYGKSAHAAAPQDSVDAIVLACNLVNSLQTLISRQISPFATAVLSFGKIWGGRAHNVIADCVTLQGTLRTLDPKVRHLLKQQLLTVTTQTANGFGGTAKLVIEPGYDALINDTATTAVVEQVARRILGDKAVHVLEQASLGVEDFAEFAKKRPASYNRLGVANQEKGIVAPLHNQHFDVDEAAIRHGILIQVMSTLALMGVDVDD